MRQMVSIAHIIIKACLLFNIVIIGVLMLDGNAWHRALIPFAILYVIHLLLKRAKNTVANENQQSYYVLLVVSDQVKDDNIVFENIVDQFWETGKLGASGQCTREEWIKRHPDSVPTHDPFFVLMDTDFGTTSKEQKEAEDMSCLRTHEPQEVIDFLLQQTN